MRVGDLAYPEIGFLHRRGDVGQGVGGRNGSGLRFGPESEEEAKNDSDGGEKTANAHSENLPKLHPLISKKISKRRLTRCKNTNAPFVVMYMTPK